MNGWREGGKEGWGAYLKDLQKLCIFLIGATALGERG